MNRKEFLAAVHAAAVAHAERSAGHCDPWPAPIPDPSSLPEGVEFLTAPPAELDRLDHEQNAYLAAWLADHPPLPASALPRPAGGTRS